MADVRGLQRQQVARVFARDPGKAGDAAIDLARRPVGRGGQMGALGVVTLASRAVGQAAAHLA